MTSNAVLRVSRNANIEMKIVVTAMMRDASGILS